MEVRKTIRRLLYRVPIGRLLIFDKWFRVAVIGFACLIVFFCLFLPRIWTVSPAGFEPVIRVSGLDVSQAWSLGRSARRSMEDGKYERAHFGWLAAIANNPADPDLVRSALNCFLENPDWQRRVDTSVQQCFWLLKLTDTNITDLELVARVLEKGEQFERIRLLLETSSQPPAAALRAAHLKALFHSNDFRAFEREWRDADGASRELQLYRFAVLASAVGDQRSLNALSQLEQALQSDDHVLAARLLISASERRLDLERCDRALAHLERQSADRLADHIAHWRLISVLVSPQEALQRIERRNPSVHSAADAILLARLYRQCGGTAAALRFLKPVAASIGSSPQFWIEYAGELLAANDWAELQRVAFQIRSRNAHHRSLKAFSYFLEARCNLAKGRDASADAAFQSMLDWSFEHSELGIAVAEHLIGAGQEAMARALLGKLEPSSGDEFRYWASLFKTAARLKEVDLMNRAARKAYELRSDDPVAANNYLAVLLIQREQPLEALRLAFELTLEFPDWLIARINHAGALLANDRPREAEEILEKIPIHRLSPSELSLYYWNQFEAALQLNHRADARLYLAQIDQSQLYPPQREWLARSER